MVEMAIGLVINKLIPLLNEEDNLLRGIHKEVNGLKRELISIQRFLRDADTRAEAEEGDNVKDGVRSWVEELAEAALKIENVIDQYMYNTSKSNNDQQALRRQEGEDESRVHRRMLRFFNFLRRISCLICEIKPRHDIATNILELKQEIRDINQRGTAYPFLQQRNSSHVAPKRTLSDPREEARHLNTAEVIGIKNDLEELVARLEAGDPQHEVVAIVGMGGIGKTTIAHQVFEEVKGKFRCHAWIDVSQTYTKVEVLRSLMIKLYKSRKESVAEGIDQETDIYALSKGLRDYLEGKSFIVVFDDVWDSTNFWANIRNALPKFNHENENHRGRIVITTRNKKVAYSCKISTPVHVHQMKVLDFENSMQLFCNKALHSDKHGCPAELENLCSQAVHKCGGLPLAIVVVGGLLATKTKSVGEWTKLISTLSLELESNQYLASIRRILSFSYNDLPYYIKPCILFFGIYPEDYSIKNKRVVRQWIAEGFVKPQKDKTMEVVAEEYLSELMSRNMVQVSEVNPDSCRVHDLMRDFILTKMDDLRFCWAVSKNDDSDFERLTKSYRRISISKGCSEDAIVKNDSIRSVFVFNREEMSDSLLTKIFTSFKFLKVLNFEDTLITCLPDEIGYMFHLKYLSVRRSKVKFLPKSIWKLENLETLDLRDSLVDELPVEINRLRKMRHLLIYPLKKNGVKLKKGFGCLNALQILSKVDVDDEDFDVLEEIGKLRELRKLGIVNLKSNHTVALCVCIQKLRYIESIVVDAAQTEPIDLEFVKVPPKFLRRLDFDGPIKSFPRWISKLESLVRIKIVSSELEHDPLEALQNLPNLIILEILKDSYNGEKLEFKAGVFRKLKILVLINLKTLNTLVIQEGALLSLEDFSFGRCPRVKEMMPFSAFSKLKNLKEILFVDLSISLLLLHDFRSILRVPTVRFELCGRQKDLSWVIKAQECFTEAEKEESDSMGYDFLEFSVEARSRKLG